MEATSSVPHIVSHVINVSYTESKVLRNRCTSCS